MVTVVAADSAGSSGESESVASLGSPQSQAKEGLDPLRSFRLDGRVAVVTGASSGLGRRFAAVLASVGATVVAAARRQDRLEELAAGHEGIYPHVCDLTRAESPGELVAATLERFGRLDVVVNNAGISDVVPALDELREQFQNVLETNLVTPFVICQHAARAMIGSGIHGSIVNVSSILGLVGLGAIPQAAYCASKGGLVVLTRELSAQWARHGIRVNALAPGFFLSELTRELFESERGRAFLARRTPLERGGLEHELDGALLFLASGASSYVTGQVLVVDGGWTAV